VLRKSKLIANAVDSNRERKLIHSWEVNSERNLLHQVKRKTVELFSNENGIQIMVETGTCLGEMVFATKSIFKTIYSIELDEKLYQGAQRRFKDYEHIHILQGDSSLVLPLILKEVEEPVLFWLDAHFSGGITARGELDSPVSAEMEAILDHPVKGHVILIDDASDFVGKSGYPTIDELKCVVFAKWSDASINVKDDIIRISQK